MTKKRFRYVAAIYIAVLLFTGLGVGLTRDDEIQADGPSAAEVAAAENPDAQIVEIIQDEWSLAPATLVLKAGEVTFVLNNEGKKTHDFQVSKEGFDKKSKRVRPGGNRDFKVTLEPGEYVFFCPISGHRGKGMEGRLIVE